MSEKCKHKINLKFSKKRIMKHFGYDCPECVLLNLKIPTYLVYDNQKVNLKDATEIFILFLKIKNVLN